MWAPGSSRNRGPHKYCTQQTHTPDKCGLLQVLETDDTMSTEHHQRTLLKILEEEPPRSLEEAHRRSSRHRVLELGCCSPSARSLSPKRPCGPASPAPAPAAFLLLEFSKNPARGVRDATNRARNLAKTIAPWSPQNTESARVGASPRESALKKESESSASPRRHTTGIRCVSGAL